MTLSVAYVTSVPGWLDDQMFNVDASINMNDVSTRWSTLQLYLAEQDIDLHTYDKFPSTRDVDLWIIEDPNPSKLGFVLRRRLSPKKLLANLIEPPVVNPWGWRNLRYYRHMVARVLTWQSDLCGRYDNFWHWNFPVPIDRGEYAHYRDNKKENLCLMMHSHKTNDQPGELYSLRREIIRYFEKRGDCLLDLYGRRWNNPSGRRPFITPLYKGTTPDKNETYSKYRFAFCIDNSVVPGYVTYDPFISMATGTVPIYLPMPDSLDYIPPNTFVDFSQFDSLDRLVERLQEIASGDEYEAYRRRGWEFVTSDRFAPFTIERFCEDMYRGIVGKAT